MNVIKKIGIAMSIGIVVLFALHFSQRDSNYKSDIFISTAQARVGRPLTPVSVAGVSRRTSRRVSRRR
jgi:hypothetical protein